MTRRQASPEAAIGFGVVFGIIGIFLIYSSRYTGTYCLQYYFGICAQYEIVRPYYLFEPMGYASNFLGVVLVIVGAVRSSRS